MVCIERATVYADSVIKAQISTDQQTIIPTHHSLH